MIEQIVLNYLDENMDVGAYMEKPEEPEDEYILIEKTSGAYENFIASAEIVIQSYAGSLYRAAELNESVKQTMENIIELDEISKCSLNSDYNYTDTSKRIKKM